jgi:Flp pilus assembly protein TadG
VTALVRASLVQEKSMLCLTRQVRRRGATLVECAIVLPVTFFLILGLIIGGMGVFRYQEVAALAREGARWASVHGGQCVREANPTNSNPTLTSASDIYNNAIAPAAVSLDPSQLAYSASWANSNEMPTYLDYTQNPPVWRTNTVTVTVTYQWIPELYLGGITLSSTSVMPVNY